MYEKALCCTKTVLSRCLKPFKKKKSHEDKEFGNYCSELLKKSLITGFAEIAETKSSLRRAIKLFVFFICVTGFICQTWEFLQIYQAYPTVLDISVDYPQNFNAPAITICSRNRLLRQLYCKTYPENCLWEKPTWETFCGAYRRLCPKSKPENFNFGIPDLIAHTNPNRSNAVLNAIGPKNESSLILGCTIRGMASNIRCNSSIMIQAAKYGYPYKCFSLLSLLGKQSQESAKVTVTDEYHIVLNMQPEEYFSIIEFIQVYVLLHDPRKVVNAMTEGIALSAGKYYKISLTMEERKRLPPPYTSKCMDYLNAWKKKGGYGPLSKKDCTDLCKIKAMTEEYGCVGQTITYPNNYTICDDKYIDASPEVNERCDSSCQDACEENIYYMTSETIDDLSNRCDNLTDEHCKNKYLGIQVSFSRMLVQKFQQIPRFECIELFSYIGGYIGLWLGISLVTLCDFMEMIYDLMAYPFRKKRRNKKMATHIEHLRHHTV